MPAVPAIDPAKSVLLVMDYQPAVINTFPGIDALLARVEAAIDLGRKRGVTIGYVRVGFTDDDYAAVPEHNRLFAAIAADRQMHHDDPAAQIDPRLAPQDGDIIVRKTRVGAFSTTDLDQQLKQRGIDTLILAGVSTSGVVLSTVRDAFDRDYRIYVLADASGDRDDQVHTMLTEKLFPRQAHVIVVDQLAELLTR